MHLVSLDFKPKQQIIYAVLSWLLCDIQMLHKINTDCFILEHFKQFAISNIIINFAMQTNSTTCMWCIKVQWLPSPNTHTLMVSLLISNSLQSACLFLNCGVLMKIGSHFFSSRFFADFWTSLKMTDSNSGGIFCLYILPPSPTICMQLRARGRSSVYNCD